MYVKVIDQRGPSRIYRMGGEAVDIGSVPWWLHDGPPPHEADLSDLIKHIGRAADTYDRTLIYEEPYGYKGGDHDSPFWKLRWAVFQKAESDETRMVISTGPIFVLGDNGKTIDRTPQ